MMSISQDDIVMSVPILPEEFEIKISVDNKTYTILQFGEIIRPGDRRLRQFDVKSYFPAEDEPETYIYAIETFIKNKVPVRFILNRSENGKILFDINMLAVIENFSYREEGGETGDIQYTIQFTEFREYTAKVIQ